MDYLKQNKRDTDNFEKRFWWITVFLAKAKKKE